MTISVQLTFAHPTPVSQTQSPTPAPLAPKHTYAVEEQEMSRILF